MFNLATLFVDIKADQAPFDRAMGGVRGQLTTANVAAGTFVGNVASMMARAAVSMGGGLFAGTIRSASGLNESISKSRAIFGDAAGAIAGNADAMAAKFGLPKQAMIDGAVAMGQMAKTAGQSQDASAAFGGEMANLAADAMSFYNVPMDEALRKIRSGLSGEAEPLRDFGVFLNEATVGAEALAMGISKTGKNLTEGEKIMARASLIQKGLADAAGDLDRTFSGTENQTRLFWGTLENLGTSIGKVMLPAWDLLLSGANAAMGGLKGWFDDTKGSAGAWVASIMEGLTTVGVMWRNWGELTEITALSMVKTWVGFSSTIQSVAGTIAGYLLLPSEYLVSGFATAIEAVGGLWDALMEKMGTFADVLLRPIRDLTNALGITDRSVEEQFSSYKGLFDAPAEGAKQFAGYIGGLRADLAGMGSGAASQIETIDDQIAAITGRMAGREAGIVPAAGGKPKSELAMLAESADRASKMGGGEGGAGGDKFKSEIVGAADFASKLRLAQASEDVPAKQLTELQQIREQDMKNGELLAKMADQSFGAILA